MSNFKKQIMNVLTEAFERNDKDKISEVLSAFKTNSTLREMYLFYENFEKKYFEDKILAENYVNILSEKLKGKMNWIASSNHKFLFESVGDYGVDNEILYEYLDVLCEEDSLNNIDKKLIAKKYLVEFLLSKKNIEDENVDITMNENVLNTVLVTNFNNYYNNTLNEEEKKELSKILSMSTDEFITNFNTIKEEVSNKINTVITESEGELKEKLNLTINEIHNMKINKYNYFKLTELKNGL